MADRPNSPPLRPPSLSPSLLLGLEAIDSDFDFDFDAFLQPPQNESPAMPPVLRSGSRPRSREGNAPDCFEAVLTCFPDLCHDYFWEVAPKHEWDSQRLITHLLDEQEKGNPYPKRSLLLKRKRPKEDEKDEEEELRKRFESAGPAHVGKGRDYFKTYTNIAKMLLKSTYPQMYSTDVDGLLKQNDNRLYQTYLLLDRVCAGGEGNSKYRFKKTAHRRPPAMESISQDPDEATRDALEEFRAASATCQLRAAKEAEQKQKEKEEADNFERAKAEGTISDCGCCFDELPLNRMVHCDGAVAHWFCRSCARRMAENAVGLSKYQLDCMSMDGCDATFSKDQKDLFLDDNLVVALDKIEQEAVLRLAGIENLESCPFCSYAEEYPPVEENKEFRCLNPDCALVSCRHCRQETHIPKTCEEAAQEIGHSARRKIEEAMSAALIRKCNKCGTPFIKENGCNKMTCTRNGCHNVQCYVCSKSCDYSHFDDSSRGGKKGNCPLFDSVEQRHDDEVQAAEEDARKQLAKENPALDDELLKFNFSEKVKKDEEMRKAANPGVVRPLIAPIFGYVHAPVPAAQQAQAVHNDRGLLQIRFPRPDQQAVQQPQEGVQQAQVVHNDQGHFQNRFPWHDRQAVQRPLQGVQRRQQAAHRLQQSTQRLQQVIRQAQQQAVLQPNALVERDRMNAELVQATQEIRDAQREHEQAVRELRQQFGLQVQENAAQDAEPDRRPLRIDPLMMAADQVEAAARAVLARDQEREAVIEEVRVQQARLNQRWVGGQVHPAAQQQGGLFAAAAANGRAPAVKNAGLHAAPNAAARGVNNAWPFGGQHPVLSPSPADGPKPGAKPGDVIDLTRGSPRKARPAPVGNNPAIPALPAVGLLGQRYDMQFQPAYGFPPGLDFRPADAS